MEQSRIAALEAEIATLKRDLDRVTNAEYLTEKLTQIGVVDGEWKARAETAERQLAEFKQEAAEVVEPFAQHKHPRYHEVASDDFRPWHGIKLAMGDFRRARTFLDTLQTKDDTHA